MIHRKPDKAGSGSLDSSGPADAGTAHERDIRWSGQHASVTMPAEMDLTNSSDVSDLLAAAASQSPEVITADMTATMFCDSAGVHALARAHELAAASGSELRLALGDSPAARIVQLIGLDQIVPVYRDVQQSLATPGPDLTAALTPRHDPCGYIAWSRPAPSCGSTATLSPLNGPIRTGRADRRPAPRSPPDRAGRHREPQVGVKEDPG
jgi:anti-anti-sigma factor